MKNRIKLLFSIIFVLSNLLSQTQIVIGEGLIGQALLNYLVENYKPMNTLGYDNARTKLYGEIDIYDGNKLTGVYSGYTISIDNLDDLLPEVYTQGINCEHTWPQSYGAGDEPQKSDMHHLYPVKSNINSSRSNAPYYEIPDNNTDIWFRNDYSQETIPIENINEFSEKENNSPHKFEPRDEHKGNAARSIFYFYTMIFFNNIINKYFFNLFINFL